MPKSKPETITRIRHDVYIGKKDVDQLVSIVTAGYSGEPPRHTEYRAQYRRDFYMHFTDHPHYRWDGCLEIPEHPLHAIFADMQKLQAVEDKRRAERIAGCAGHQTVEELRATFKPTQLETYRANLTRAVDEWDKAHKDKVDRFQREWVMANPL